VRTPESHAPAAIGSRWWGEGREWEVAALRAPHSERNEAAWWFVLVAHPGQSPHPCGWWPERSFLRLFRRIESA